MIYWAGMLIAAGLSRKKYSVERYLIDVLIIIYFDNSRLIEKRSLVQSTFFFAGMEIYD